VLQDLEFVIRQGESVGVVGPSGAGKSTLLHLLLRLRDPTRGSYTIEGVDVRDIANATWHGNVAFLPQEPHILDGTVAENIRFFRRGISDEAIERAARMAHIQEDIEGWVGGYATHLGHRSDAVSGGQRQRLCLARALAASPSLLLLDEPTSSLDLRSEGFS
jgi:ABC-type multidrug transport system fused ATPase/permease subunit